MKGFPREGLRRQMFVYFAFIAIVFLTLALEVTLFLDGPEVRGAIEQGAQGFAAGGDIEAVLRPVDRVLVKLGVGLVILLATVSLVLILFIKRITIPLEKILAGANEISSGNLSETIPVLTRDEIGRIAICINELAANYQEVLLLVKHQVGIAREGLAETGVGLSDPEARTQVDEALAELDAIVAEFGREYYEGSADR